MTLDPAHGGRVRWTAGPPPGAGPPLPEQPEPPYTGPPKYPAPPRWGFPNLIWRWPTTVPGTDSARSRPVELLRPIGTWTIGVLTALAVFAVLAGGAELWRYVLVALSRDQALNTGTVELSDGLVKGLWYPVPILLFAAMVLGVWWLQLARAVAAERAEVEAPHGSWSVGVRVVGLWVLLAVVAAVEYKVDLPPLVVGIGAPLLIVTVAFAAVVLTGPVLAELEHLALRRPPEQRPRPSRLVLLWWAGCVLNAVLVAVTLWRRLGEGVQAQADAVLLTGLTHFVAALLAVLTALVVRRIGLLLAPAEPGRLRKLRVIAVRGGDEPPLRAVRPAGARR